MVEDPKMPSGDAIDPSARQRLLSNTRFKLRLMLLVGLIVLVLTALLFFLVSRVFANLTPSIESDLRGKVTSGLVELRQSTDLGVLTGNRDIVAEAAARYQQDADYHYISVRTAAGELLFETGWAPALQATSPLKLASNDDSYASWTNVEVEGLSVGRIELAVSKQRLQAGTQLYQRILWAGGIGAIVALALAWLFVNRYLVPILQITRRAFLELEHKTEVALASTRAKGQFLANMSHEIRTPMNGVLGMVHLIQQTSLDAQQRRYIDVIDGSAKSLLTIVNDILDFSKLEADKYELFPERCSLKTVVSQTVSLFQPRAWEKGVQLSAVIDDSVPTAVLMDTDRLRQVLSNLLSNAIKFTDSGEVRVVVGTHHDEQTDGPVLVVRVEDTGVGISPEARTKLFQAFSQVDGSSTRSHEGTGLGLAISRRLVELMGGRIDYGERPGGGSVFFFQLPVVACSEEPPVESTGCWVKSFESHLPVLVVDDNEINQMVCLEMLEELGLEVYIVSEGREALEVVAETSFALVLMDCQMPGMDGYQTTRAIRERERADEHLPIIACTAHALEEERQRVREAGMDGFLAKPLEPTALRRELSKWLSVREFADVVSPPSVEATTPEAVVEPDRPAVSLAEPTDLEELDGNRAPSARVLSLFIEKAPGDLARLRQAADDGNASEVKALAHKLKGSAGSIGARRLAEVCNRLQIHAPTVDVAELPAWVELIERLHAAVRKRIELPPLLESSAP